MDFNIDNESFAAAYKCLNSANELLENGLGNFSELDNSALVLIDNGNINNNNRLNNINQDCFELKDKMYRTIEYLSKINSESAFYFECVLNNDGFGDINSDMFTVEGKFKGFVKASKAGMEIKDGYTGFDFRGQKIYYDSESNEFYVLESRDTTVPGTDGNVHYMIYNVPISKKIDSDYILDNIDDVTIGSENEIRTLPWNFDKEQKNVELHTLPWELDDIKGDMKIDYLLPDEKIGDIKENVDVEKFLSLREVMESDFYKGDSGFYMEPDKDYREMDPGFYKDK